MAFEYKNILIATDGSELSKKAFNRAIYIAKRDDATLVLAHVVEDQNFPKIETYLKNIYEYSQLAAEEMLNEYEKKAGEAGVKKIKKVIKFGSPKGILLEEIIPEEKVDLVVLGATGVSAVERILIGSVSESIFRYSKSDVLVIR